MNENKVTISNEEFVDLITDEIMEMVNDNDSLNFILMGGIVTGILSKKIFSDSNTVSITKKEYVELTAKAISEFTKDEKAKAIATPVSLLALILVSKLERKLFNEEDN